MDSVLRAFAVYVILLVVFRIGGKRTFAEVTTFDFVLLLIVAETTQQALIGQDYSVTNFLIVITTLVATDIGLSLVKQRSPYVARLLEGAPLVIVENGRLLRERTDKVRVDEDDVMAAARHTHGLERIEQIRYAVLERNGGITIIPKNG